MVDPTPPSAPASQGDFAIAKLAEGLHRIADQLSELSVHLAALRAEVEEIRRAGEIATGGAA